VEVHDPLRRPLCEIAYTSAADRLKSRSTRPTTRLQKLNSRIAATRGLIAGQVRCLRHEVIPFRDARRPRSRNSVVFDGGFVIAHLLE